MDMRRFWDARAREDPWYFVDNRLEYGSPDEERFWAAGESDLGTLLGSLGAAIDPSDRVVEIGCGIGRMTRAIARRAGHVVALDVSERMLELAREQNPAVANVDWLHSDGATLAGVEDESADAVLSFVVFHHLPDPALVLGYVREMGRVLRPGGWAAFQFSNDPAAHRRTLGRRLRALRGPGGQAAREWLGSAVPLAALREAAAAAGLTVERIDGAGTLACFTLLRRPREALGEAFS